MFTVDLFAGAGGLTRGLRQAGLDVQISVEVNRYAAATYRANFPSIDLVQDDIKSVPVSLYRRKLKERGVELGALVAGLPCQGFSESNRKTRTTRNPRNQLYREFLTLVRELSPRWFIVENVAGLATLESGAFLESMLGAFRSAGYRVSFDVLNACDFGIPQSRRRAFLVGNRLGVRFDFPAPSGACATPTVRDAIGDLPVLRNGASNDALPYRISWEKGSTYARSLRPACGLEVCGNSVSRSSARVIARYKHIPPGRNWNAIPRRLMRNYSRLDDCHTGVYFRLEWNSASKVIGNFRKNMLIHPGQNRGLSIREAARLQSFPDSHCFLGPLNDRQQQVGDAVPPLLAEAVGVAVRHADELASRKRNR